MASHHAKEGSIDGTHPNFKELELESTGEKLDHRKMKGKMSLL